MKQAIYIPLQLSKKKLEVPLQHDKFAIRLQRPGTNKILAIHTVQLHSMWKWKELYQTHTKLNDTSVYLAENLTAATNIFYECRMLRKSRVTMTTWIYDVQHCAETESDLKWLKLQERREDTPFAARQTSLAPCVPDVSVVSSDDSIHGASSLQLFTPSDITTTQGFEVREGIQQYDSCDMGQFRKREHRCRTPVDVLSQLGNTSVYGE